MPPSDPKMIAYPSAVLSAPTPVCAPCGLIESSELLPNPRSVFNVDISVDTEECVGITGALVVVDVAVVKVLLGESHHRLNVLQLQTAKQEHD